MPLYSYNDRTNWICPSCGSKCDQKIYESGSSKCVNPTCNQFFHYCEPRQMFSMQPPLRCCSIPFGRNPESIKRCTCHDQKTITKHCQNCRKQWQEEEADCFKKQGCEQHGQDIQICIGLGPVGDLCKNCEDEGFYIEDGFGGKVKNKNF